MNRYLNARIEDIERDCYYRVFHDVSGKAQHGKCVTNYVLRGFRKIQVVLLAAWGAFVVSFNLDGRRWAKERVQKNSTH